MTNVGPYPDGSPTDAAPRSPGAFCVACSIAALGWIFPYALVALVLRLVMARVVFVAGQAKVDGPVLPISIPDMNWTVFVTLPMTVKDGAYQLFERLAGLPIPASIAAPVVSYAEFILPICLVLGLATRFAALCLLIITAAIQWAAAPEALWTLHIYWISILLVLVSLGPGLISFDHLIRHLYLK